MFGMTAWGSDLRVLEQSSPRLLSTMLVLDSAGAMYQSLAKNIMSNNVYDGVCCTRKIAHMPIYAECICECSHHIYNIIALQKAIINTCKRLCS